MQKLLSDAFRRPICRQIQNGATPFMLTLQTNGTLAGSGAVDIAETQDDHIQQETSRIAAKRSLHFRHADGEEIAKWRKGQAEPKHAG